MNKDIGFFTTPNGEEFAIVPRQMLEDMLDVEAYEKASEKSGNARAEPLGSEEMRALLAAKTPLAFWRRKRGLTQAQLAKSAKTTQPHIADLENGRSKGSMEIMARVASALGLSLDDLH